jgi:hypothetical protein
MSIVISNLTVQNNAASGTVIGVLTAQHASTVIPCAYSLTKGSTGLFAIAGNQLVTAWNTPAVPEFYSVRIYALTNESFSGSATLVINVVTSTSSPPPAAPPPPPPPAPPSPIPTAITLSPASATTPDNAPAGTVLTTAAVTMSDGSQISGLNLMTGRALTSADDGTHSTTASQGGQSISVEFSI